MIAGIDIGSGSTKLVLMDENKNILSRKIMKTTADFAKVGREIVEMALKEHQWNFSQVEYVATTGLGRYNVPFRDIQITEITCAAKGVFYLLNDVHCVLDIGAQSTRAIKLRDAGKVRHFRANDRCAAGSGGFLERAARYLEVSIQQVGRLSLHSQNSQPISSVCAVLGESEIINHVSNGTPVEDILRGIHDSLADRACSLLKRIGVDGKVAFIGGVAKQAGMVRALEEKLGMPIYVPPRPEFVVALGAALLGLQRLQKRKNRSLEMPADAA